MSMFPWAHFRKKKSAIKIHTVINLQGKIPDFILVSTGKTHDVHVMDVLEWEAGSWYAMDRAYLDFSRLYCIHQCGAFFVTRGYSENAVKSQVWIAVCIYALIALVKAKFSLSQTYY